MRIALLHYSAPPVVGGVEAVLGYHARLMTDAGHEVRILAARGEQTDPRIPFISLPLMDSKNPEVLAVKESLDRGVIPPEFAHLVSRLKQDLTDALERVDAVIAHNICSLNKNLALTAALHELSQEGRLKRLILWHHDLAWTTPRYQPELHDGYPWDLLRTAWPGVTQVTISQFRREEAAALFGIPPAEVVVVPNGVDADAFLKLGQASAALRRDLRLAETSPLLLLPVRITPRKNIEFAMRVTAALRDRMPRAGLIVTGPPGPHNPRNAAYLESMQSLRAGAELEQAVHFLAEEAGRPLTDEEVGDMYRLADALLLPSREEGFGIPLLEAGLAGMPMFCADIPPLRELGEGCAEFFPLESSPVEVAARIADRLEGDGSFRMRQRVLGGYTWEQVYQNKIAPLLREG